MNCEKIIHNELNFFYICIRISYDLFFTRNCYEYMNIRSLTITLPVSLSFLLE